jgi:RHS repeat-associated protein
MTNPLTGVSTFTYDVLNRVTAESTPSGGEITYEYDLSGLLTSLTNARGDIRIFDYDEAGWLIGFTDAEGETSYTYDSCGNLLSATDENGAIYYDYDGVGRVIAMFDTLSNTTGYSYDEVGNLQALTYPNGQEVSYTYDEAGRMIGVTDWLGNETFYDYDGAGNIIKIARPNGTALYHNIDNANRLIAMYDEHPNGAYIRDLEFTYHNGLIESEYSWANGSSTTRDYDEVGRLSEVTSDFESGDSWEYSYDVAGNITDANHDLSTYVESNLNMVYDDQNRLIEINENEVDYDAEGNMISYTLSNTSTVFAYDSASRLISTSNATYVYDVADNRISRTDAGGTTTFAYDASGGSNRLLASTDDNGTTYYIYGVGLIGCITPDGDYLTYHFDVCGSVTEITDMAGNVIDTFEYDPYGKLIDHQGDTDTLFHYNGRYGVIDDGNGLLFMRARYYSTEIMRFINADVLTGTIADPATLNRYAFANGNPVRYVDPFGRSAALIAGGHLALDVAGLIPEFGMIFDGVNAVWYAAEGDWLNAGISAVAFVPLVGDVIGGVRLGIKGAEAATIGIKAADKVGDVAGAVRAADKVGDVAGAVRATDSVVGTIRAADLPPRARGIYEAYNAHGWRGNVSGQTPGTRAGRGWDNSNIDLPPMDATGNPITYREFDVNNRIPGAGRDAERFVRGSDGSVYYTTSHYGSFVRVN